MRLGPAPLSFLASLALTVFEGPAYSQLSLSTAFTYQGQLKSAGSPANGSYDLQFKLFDSLGNQLGAAICSDNVAIVNGLFTVSLDFGASAFTGDKRFLEIGVRQDSTAGNCGTGSYTTLSPRQELTATPYARFSAAPWATNGTTISNTNGGNVGIGTTSPATSLHIVDPSVAQLKLDRTGGASLLMQAGTTVTRVGSSTTTRLGFLIGGNDQMTLDTSGHLGIGTASPETDLHVFRGSAGTITANANSTVVLENNNSNYLSIFAPDANESALLFGRPGSTAPNASGGIVFNNSGTADGLQLRTGGNITRMVISGTGNVGIGTINPTAKLHVVGSSSDVILPANSIGSAEISDEGGVACNIVNCGETIVGFSSLHTCASRTITPPAAGFVLAIGTVELFSDPKFDTDVFLGVNDSSGALANCNIHRNTLLAGHSYTLTVQGMFSVTAAAKTIYLLVQPDVSGRSFAAGPAHLSLLYVPTSYGTVDGD